MGCLGVWWWWGRGVKNITQRSKVKYVLKQNPKQVHINFIPNDPHHQTNTQANHDQMMYHCLSQYTYVHAQGEQAKFVSFLKHSTWAMRTPSSSAVWSLVLRYCARLSCCCWLKYTSLHHSSCRRSTASGVAHHSSVARHSSTIWQHNTEQCRQPEHSWEMSMKRNSERYVVAVGQRKLEGDNFLYLHKCRHFWRSNDWVDVSKILILFYAFVIV